MKEPKYVKKVLNVSVKNGVVEINDLSTRSPDSQDAEWFVSDRAFKLTDELVSKLKEKGVEIQTQYKGICG